MERRNEILEDEQQAEKQPETASECYTQHMEAARQNMEELQQALSYITAIKKEIDWVDTAYIACIQGMLTDVLRFIRSVEE